MRAALCLAALTLAAGPLAASDLVLGLPVDCDLGQTCHIQQYVDADPGEGAQDYTCGTLSYDGHDGTDFALPTLEQMRQGVDVLAAAAGVVIGFRDGMEDEYFTEATAGRVEGRECGNGVVLRHPDGWETQYCHLKSGSVTVAEGDQVARGAVLGQIGLSGRSQFPHLELGVRRNGTAVDPFAPAGGACGETVTTLWQVAPVYQPGGVLDAGFASAIPDWQVVKDGTAGQEALAPDAGAMVLFGYAFGTRAGDVMELQIIGPRGPVTEERITLDRTQAQMFRAIGSRRGEGPWPTGRYDGTVRLLRDGAELNRRRASVSVQ